MKLNLAKLKAYKGQDLDDLMDLLYQMEEDSRTNQWENYRPLPKQLPFHRSQAQTRVFCGGNRAGKTTAGAMEAVWYMKGRHPWRPVIAPNQGWICGMDTEVIDDVIVPKLMEFINESEIKIHNRNKGILQLKNDSIAKFKSYDSGPDKFQSAERRYIWFDEEPPYEIYKECRMRVGKNFPLDMWLTMTPLQGMDWSYEELISKQVPGKVEVFGSSLMDNTHIPIEVRQELYAEFKHKPEAAARLYGEYFHRSGLIYKGLQDSIHLVDPFPIPPSWPVARCVDPHSRKPSAAVWAALDPRNRLFIFQELNDDYEYLFEEFARRVREMDQNYKIARSLIDPAALQKEQKTGTTTQQYLGDLGLHTTLATRDHTIGYDAVRRRIMGEKGPTIFFFRTCPKTWKQMTNLVYDEYRFRTDKDPKETQKKRNDDLADCVRYICAEPFAWEQDWGEGVKEEWQGSYSGWGPQRLPPGSVPLIA